MYLGLDQQGCLRSVTHTGGQLEGLQDTQWLKAAVSVCLVLTTQTQTFIESQLNLNCSLGNKKKQT